MDDTAAGRIPMHEGAVKPVAGVSDQNRDTIPTPRFLRSSSAGDSFGADQQRLQISGTLLWQVPYSTNVFRAGK